MPAPTRTLALLLAVPFLACGGPSLERDGGTTAPLDAGPDAGGAVDAGAPPEAGPVDAGCTDDCARTALTARFGSRTAAFDRAQHGLEPDGGLYVEAHFGGDPACPTASTPTPDRTLVVSGLRLRPDGGALTEADGLRVTLLDFSGAVTSAPFVRAAAARATPRFVAPGALVSFTLEATFEAGTVTGGLAASHCASLDGP